jgi:NAD(P)-dependent dehydrogenase (short-subunit alcohol dehydrogenase family)
MSLDPKVNDDGTSTNMFYSLRDLMKTGYTAVVTGASSGIGRAACLRFASVGMNVFMVDIDAKDLAVAQKLCKAQVVVQDNNHQPFILAEVVDVSDENAMSRLADQVFEAIGKCHIVMNNAGIGDGGGSLCDIEKMKRMVSVNTFGPINGCLAFVERMKRSGEPGIIINTGSKQGITMPPGNLAYNMSKAALKVYTEGLEHELMLERKAGKCQIRAALLVPGWVNTSIVLKSERAKAERAGLSYDDSEAFFHEEKPQSGAWMPNQVIDFMISELEIPDRFYIICPDNDVDRETDNLRMQWTIGDITENRPPLSRWHPDYKDKFIEFVQTSKK